MISYPKCSAEQLSKPIRVSLEPDLHVDDISDITETKNNFDIDDERPSKSIQDETRGKNICSSNGSSFATVSYMYV